MTKRIPWAVAGSLVALSLTLSACGGGSGGGQTTAPPTTAPAATTEDRESLARVAAFVPVGATAQSPEEAAAYWTPERLRSAEPLSTDTGADRLRIGAAEDGEEAEAPAPDGSEGGVDGTLASGASTDSPELPSGEPGSQEPGFPYTSFEWPGSRTQFPAATAGKVFFVNPDNGQRYVCSGTVVTSQNESVVWTAGHCVYDPKTSAYKTNWVFVPAYDNGNAPFGIWPARSLATPNGWTRHNVSYDIGAAVVEEVEGKTLMDAVGGSQGLRWNTAVTPGMKITDLGYPAGAPFDGEKLWTCDTTVAAFDATPAFILDGRPATGTQPRLQVGCDMTGGSSGGGWLVDYQPERGWGYVTSVNSYSDGSPVMQGPFHDSAAENLYQYANAQ